MRFVRYILPLLAASGLVASGRPGLPDPSTARAQAALARLPLRFERNAGQWNSAVRYAAHGDGYSVMFTAAGPSIVLAEGQRVDLALLGGNAAPEIEGQNRVPQRTDYFIGAKDKWRTSVPVFSRIVYRGVYPGIDVAYYGSASCIEYDFQIAPGADPSDIRLHVYGADRVSVGEQGDLTIDAGGSQLLQKLPAVYQSDPRTGDRRIVEGSYRVLGSNEVGFRLAKYDRAKPLVIDPLLVYSSYWGGTAADQVNAVKAGPNGQLYIVGRTLTSDLVATVANYAAQNVRVYLNDMFILVLDTTAAGNYSTVYLSYLGGTGDDYPTAMDLDYLGNLYITGYTTSGDFPMAGNSVQITPLSTTSNAFAVEFNPAAAGTDALVYSTYVGGSLDNRAYGIAAGGNGLIYLIGSTNSVDFPVTANAYSSVLWGSQDAFLCKIDTGTALMAYATYIGGEDIDDGRAIAVDARGRVFFAVATQSASFPLGYLPGEFPYRTTLAGVRNTVVGLIDMTKSGNPSLVFDSYFGGTSIDEVQRIAVTPNGNVVLTGYTLSQDFPVTPDALQHAPHGGSDVFVTVVNMAPPTPSQFLVYSTYLGGSGDDVAYDVAADTAGNIYLAGYTMSPDFPTTPDAVVSHYGNGIDIFVVKLQPGVSGTKGMLFSTYIGDVGLHVPTCLTLGYSGQVFVGGYTNLGLPAAGANANVYAGGYSDGFVLALAQLAGQPVPTAVSAAPSRLQPPATPEQKRSSPDHPGSVNSDRR